MNIFLLLQAYFWQFQQQLLFYFYFAAYHCMMMAKGLEKDPPPGRSQARW